jgi:endonuclease-3 related protein
MAFFAPGSEDLLSLYRSMAAHYGEQPWWPADSVFEVVVGAVLTQNAAWSNVEKAIERLKAADVLSLEALHAIDHARLGDLIRPSGYYNIKAKRLKNLCAFLVEIGGLGPLADQPLSDQRRGLLSVNGVGPETADDILLYALERPVFVIDAYTRRLLQRVDLADGSESYEMLRQGFEAVLPADVRLYQQYHALIVIHAKEVCRKVPRCGACPLAAQCPTGNSLSRSD